MYIYIHEVGRQKEWLVDAEERSGGGGVVSKTGHRRVQIQWAKVSFRVAQLPLFRIPEGIYIMSNSGYRGP